MGDPKAPRLRCLLRVVVLLFTDCFINESGFFFSPTHTYVKKPALFYYRLTERLQRCCY